jgi:adenosine deaminase
VNKIFKLIKRIPKAELHLHIEGSLEPRLMFKLAKRNRIKIPFKSIDEIKSAYNFHNLQSFLNIYYQGAKVLIKEEDFFDLTWMYMQKCKEENIVHTEIFFDPQIHTGRGIKFELVINGIHRAIVKAENELGISSKIIMCFLRDLDEQSAFNTLDQALMHKDKIIGVGLDSAEIKNPPRKFERVFKKAMEEGFITVAHAGEEGPPEYIWEALDLLKVKRIDHGVQCLKDEKLIKRLRDDQIPLTVCPLSNVKLCVFEKLEEHNLKKLLNKDLIATINSDDPAYFGGYLNTNLIECQIALDLATKDIKKLILNSFKSSFLSKDKIEKWINQVNSLI